VEFAELGGREVEVVGCRGGLTICQVSFPLVGEKGRRLLTLHVYSGYSGRSHLVANDILDVDKG